MDEASANEVVAALVARGVVADKAPGAEGSWDVAVPRTQRHTAVQILAGAGLPRANAGVSSGEERGGLVPSDDAERSRRQRTLERDLAATLVSLENVREARVHLTLPAPPLRPGSRGAEAGPARASVLLVVRAGDEAPSDAAVRALVIGAVDGLVADAISVVVAPVDVPPAPVSRLVELGPFAVAEESLTPLRTIVWAAGGFILALALSVLLLARRRRP